MSAPHTLEASAPQGPHAVGQPIALELNVLDSSGQRIAAPALRTVAPGGHVIDPAHVRFDKEGRYSVHVEVLGPGRQVRLSKDLDVVVNDHGPTLSCEPIAWPVRPGVPVTLRGTATDALGVTSVEVAGQPVTLDEAGRWATTWTPSEGLAALKIRATDGLGLDSSTTCVGMVIPQLDPTMTAAHVHIGQEALDDQDRSDQDSAGDALHALLHGPTLRLGVHQQLLELNPLKDSCDQRVLGACVVRTRVDYQDLDIRGPHRVRLAFVQGGVRVRARLGNVRVKTTLRAGPTRASGWSSLDTLDVDLTLPLAVKQGRLQAAPAIVHAVTLGDVSTSYPGTMGSLLKASGWALEPTLKRLATRHITRALSAHTSALIRSRALDPYTSRTFTWSIPGFDSNPPTRIERTLRLSALSIRPGALTGSLAIAPSPTTKPSGASAPPPPTQSNRAVRAKINLAVLNQLLGELWRAGHFVLPPQEVLGTSWKLDLRAPPFVSAATSGALWLHVGPVDVNMQSPLGDTSFQVGGQLRLRFVLDDQGVQLPKPERISLFIQWPDTMHALVARQGLHALVGSAIDQALARAWARVPQRIAWPALRLPPQMGARALKPTDAFARATPDGLSVEFNVQTF